MMPVDEYIVRGFVFVSVEYRLAGEGASTKHPAAVEDVRDALQFIAAHSEELGADPARIGIIGVSTGGHLGLLAGPTDLTALAQRGEVGARAAAAVMGPMWDEEPQLYAEASPVRHVRAAVA